MEVEQLTLDEVLKEEFRKEELKKPPKQQIPTADVVMFIGDRAATMIAGKKYEHRRLKKGTLAFVSGFDPEGYFDTFITTRQECCYVNYLDLVPMKVISFEEFQEHMDRISKLEQQLQQVREVIAEALGLLKRGGPGTRSQVQVLLEMVLGKVDQSLAETME